MAHYEVFEKTHLSDEVLYTRDYRKAKRWVFSQENPDHYVIRELGAVFPSALSVTGTTTNPVRI